MLYHAHNREQKHPHGSFLIQGIQRHRGSLEAIQRPCRRQYLFCFATVFRRACRYISRDACLFAWVVLVFSINSADSSLYLFGFLGVRIE